MNATLQRSKEIYDEAVTKFPPYATVLMVSGGKDSMTCATVAKALGIRVDFVLHGRTGTGIEETLDYVREQAPSLGGKYIEADAGNAYEEYVLRKGFFGKGVQAHAFTYHLLKRGRFQAAISQHIRRRHRGRNVLLLNGARIEESDNRKNNLTEIINVDPSVKSNIWVNLIHHWSGVECNDFLADQKVPPNPVTQKLCRSGECMCGTMQSKADATEASYYFPKWGEWLESLKRRVADAGFPWSWGESMPKGWKKGQEVQLPLFADFQPACARCLNGKEQ